MPQDELVYVPCKVPVQMYQQIVDYQKRNQLLSRAEAMRQILIAGLRALGISGAGDD